MRQLARLLYEPFKARMSLIQLLYEDYETVSHIDFSTSVLNHCGYTLKP